jgi:hypothetical protein
MVVRSFTFSTKGFCPNFITKATKLQGSDNKAKKKKRTTPQVQHSLNTEPNHKETTKRLAPGGTGTQGRPTCPNFTQIKTFSSLQQGLPPTKRAHKHQKSKSVLDFQLQQTYTRNPTNKLFSTKSNTGAARPRPPKLLLQQHRSSPRLVAIWGLRMM